MTDFQVSALQLFLLIGLAVVVWLMRRLPSAKNPRRENWRSVWIIVYVAAYLCLESVWNRHFRPMYVIYGLLAVAAYSGLVYVWNLAEPKQ